MDQFAVEGGKVVAVSLLGYAWQWCRAPKRLHNTITWIAFAGFVSAVYMWLTPGWIVDWRASILGAYLLVQAARGSAATAKDTNTAPAANTL